MAGWPMRAAKAAGRGIATTYARGFALFVAAPLIAALVVVPEFVQHVVEIRMGMFDSLETARVLQNDPARMTAGYFKLAGLALVYLAAARFWWQRAQGGAPWWRIDRIAWWRLLLGIAVFILLPGMLAPLEPLMPWAAFFALQWVYSIATAPFAFVMIGGLVGDRAIPVPTILKRSWPWVPLLLLLFLAALPLAYGLHFLFHRIALGLPHVLLWPLMALDSLVVGLSGALIGAALVTAYEAMATGLRDKR